MSLEPDGGNNFPVTSLTHFLGDAIRQARVAKGVTQTDLARLCQVQQHHLSHLEHGKRCPSIQTLERLCDCLEIPVADIIFRAEAAKRKALFGIKL